MNAHKHRALAALAAIRNVDDANWHAVYGIASPMLQCTMDLGLLTGLRRGDLRRLDPREHLKDDGLHMRNNLFVFALPD